MKKFIALALCCASLCAIAAPAASANWETRWVARYTVRHEPKACHTNHWAVRTLGFNAAANLFASYYEGPRAEARMIFGDIMGVCKYRGLWY